jgi:hypothetical protein
MSVTLDAQGIMPGHYRIKNQCVFCNFILGQIMLSPLGLHLLHWGVFCGPNLIRLIAKGYVKIVLDVLGDVSELEPPKMQPDNRNWVHTSIIIIYFTNCNTSWAAWQLSRKSCMLAGQHTLGEESTAVQDWQQ